MKNEHSLLPPSSAARRVACPGSRALEERYKTDEMSPAAREGEAAHWLAATWLKDPDFVVGINAIAPNGETITDEMVHGADLYIATIRVRADKAILHIEERVGISTIHNDCWGTPDCWFIKKNELHIFDYKYGHGYVEVFENWQLIEYAAGILELIPFERSANNFHIIFHIVQPRTYDRVGKVRSWKTNVKELRPYFETLRQAEALAAQPITKTYVSTECHYCAARHACPTLRHAALVTADISLLNTPVELTAEDVGSELRYLTRAQALLEARIAGLSEEATVRIKRGQRVPHFALEETPGRLKWGVPTEEVLKLGELLGVDLAKPTDTLTPRQAVEAGIIEDLIAVYCERQRGALKLVPADPKSARKIFGGDK